MNSQVIVTINGEPYNVQTSQVPMDTSLNSFLRNHSNLPGTKFMCFEGGCGACIVTATGKDPITKKVRSWAINSCLTPIYACDGLEITTVEGIGNKKAGYHAVQKRLTQFHGTQCGYCSPGMVMNMYSLLQANDGKVTMKDIENSFGGNICRCTGYRPILDAFKSMAIDADLKYKTVCKDIEDLPKLCRITGQSCNGTCNELQRNLRLTFIDGKEWYKVEDLKELFDVWSIIGNKSYRLVAGNTAHGVFRVDRNIAAVIDVNRVPDLHTHVISPNEVRIGGNVNLTDLMKILRKAANLSGFEYCMKICQHIDLIANVPVRNVGTIAGNLSIKHDHQEFPSDLFIILLGVNAKVTISNAQGQKQCLYLNDYLKTAMNKMIIISVILKPLSTDKFLFRSYKIMPRSQNAHAYVNAAFLVENEDNKVKSANICFGGINSTFSHAINTEQFLIGKDLHSPKTLQNALKTLQDELKPDWVLPDATPHYRKNLALSLFYKFVLATCDKLPKNLKTGGEILQRPLSTGVQNFDTYREKWPMTQPIEKVDGIFQTAGEAQYVNDIPALPGQLWAAFVPANEVHAQIICIDPAEALKIPGVRYFFSVTDIPGNNSFTPTSMMMITEHEEIFCKDTVKYHGQPLGMILADTFELANKAVEFVRVVYKKTDKTVITTIRDAYACNALDRFHETAAKMEPIVDGKETDIVVQGRFEIGGQYHFTMETQTTVCVPSEDGMDVYSSTQWVDMVQVAIAQCLSVPENSLNMQVRRLGGGYGCKLSRAALIGCACALGCKLTNKPVRFVMSLESNMAVIGKRNGLISDYKVHVDSTGQIKKHQNSFAQDYGCSRNEDVVFNTLEFIKNCYNFDTWKVDAKAVVTDSASNSWCRAPGTTEGIAVIENIMEHISRVCGLDPIEVRLANIPNDSKLKTLLPEFLESVEYRKRKDDINLFNSSNRWTKRGIAVVPMHYSQPFFGSIPVIVSIFHTDGTVVITHGGVECGQGINTKVVQVAAKTLNIPMDYIKIKPSLNSVTTNSICTGGSMTSEAVCYATMKACETLLERMRPVREEIKTAKWSQITEACYKQDIALTVIHHYKKADVQEYSTWGISCAEVEVDILTGNFQLTRVDILEDTGESISPHIDLGQVEGAFVMGLGYWLSEALIYDKSGELLTNRSWNYKPPGAKDIPIDFRVTFLRNSSNPLSVLRSKATGEPSLCMSVVCVFALRHALESARIEAGINDEWLNLGAPTTAEVVFLAAGTKPELFTL